MTSLQLARAHLEKAQEFLEAAEMSLDLELLNAAVSNAVTSGINSKDAICLKLTGQTTKTESHGDAAADLSRAGPKPSELAPTLQRLISAKSKAQYQAVSVARSAATNAVRQAKTMHDAAQDIIKS